MTIEERVELYKSLYKECRDPYVFAYVSTLIME